MSTELDQWNRRARWCILALEAQEDSPVGKARACLAHWSHLLPQLPSREIRAAAHEGLQEGPAAVAVRGLTIGCLTLSSMVGGGKTTAAAWKAYGTLGTVLWLDAVRIAVAKTGAIDAWLDQIRDAAFVVVDDVGAPGTVGQWESPKVAAILTAVAARPAPSIISSNMNTTEFGAAYDAGPGGRLVDRLRMRPNRWIDLPEESESRRAHADPPPQEGELPKREARARDFLRAVDACRETSTAMGMADVTPMAVRLVADRLGQATLAALDHAVAEHGAGQARVDRALADLRERWRQVVPKAEDESIPPEPPPLPGAAQRARCSALDTLAHVAEHLGCEEGQILERIGVLRRDLGAMHQRDLLALLH